MDCVICLPEVPSHVVFHGLDHEVTEVGSCNLWSRQPAVPPYHALDKHDPEGSKYPTMRYLPKTRISIPNIETLNLLWLGNYFGPLEDGL